MTALTPGSDRFRVRALLKMSRTSVVTHLVEIGTERDFVGRCLAQPSAAEEVTLLEGILRETAVWRGLSDSAVPRFDRVVEGEGGTWMLSQFEPGTVLAQYLGAEMTLPETWVLWWMRHLLLALKALHASTPPWYLGHIEPGDVVVRDDRLFLVDLALFERIFPLRAAFANHVFVNFIAPEKRTSPQSSVQTDLYSVGALAFWLLTGYAPIVTGASSAHTMRLALDDYRPSLAPAVADLIAQLLEFYPSQRPDSSADALSRLLPFVTTMTGHKPPHPSTETEHKYAADPTRMMMDAPRAIVVDETKPRPVPRPVPRRKRPWVPLGVVLGLTVVGLSLRPVHRPAMPVTVLPAGETRLVVGPAGTSAFSWLHGCTVVFGPNSLISVPTWDGKRYEFQLLRGNVQARTGGEAGIDVRTRSSDMVHIEPGTSARIDLATGQVHCEEGSVTVEWQGRQHPLVPGGVTTLVGGSTH